MESKRSCETTLSPTETVMHLLSPASLEQKSKILSRLLHCSYAALVESHEQRRHTHNTSLHLFASIASVGFFQPKKEATTGVQMSPEESKNQKRHPRGVTRGSKCERKMTVMRQRHSVTQVSASYTRSQRINAIQQTR